jgi:hypothetical protein
MGREKGKGGGGGKKEHRQLRRGGKKEHRQLGKEKPVFRIKKKKPKLGTYESKKSKAGKKRKRKRKVFSRVYRRNEREAGKKKCG